MRGTTYPTTLFLALGILLPWTLPAQPAADGLQRVRLAGLDVTIQRIPIGLRKLYGDPVRDHAIELLWKEDGLPYLHCTHSNTYLYLDRGDHLWKRKDAPSATPLHPKYWLGKTEDEISRGERFYDPYDDVSSDVNTRQLFSSWLKAPFPLGADSAGGAERISADCLLYESGNRLIAIRKGENSPSVTDLPSGVARHRRGNGPWVYGAQSSLKVLLVNYSHAIFSWDSVSSKVSALPYLDDLSLTGGKPFDHEEFAHSDAFVEAEIKTQALVQTFDSDKPIHQSLGRVLYFITDRGLVPVTQLQKCQGSGLERLGGNTVYWTNSESDGQTVYVLGTKGEVLSRSQSPRYGQMVPCGTKNCLVDEDGFNKFFDLLKGAWFELPMPAESPLVARKLARSKWSGKRTEQIFCSAFAGDPSDVVFLAQSRIETATDYSYGFPFLLHHQGGQLTRGDLKEVIEAIPRPDKKAQVSIMNIVRSSSFYFGGTAYVMFEWLKETLDGHDLLELTMVGVPIRTKD